MKLLNIIKAKLPKKVQTKRAGYAAGAGLILFSALSYSIFFSAKPLKAATVGNSSVGTGSGSPTQRRTVVTSDGKIVTFYNAGTQAPNDISYSVSTDNGATWGSAVSVGGFGDDFSVEIDGSNNIYIAYSNGGIYAKKLTYSSGTWSQGSFTDLTGGGACGGGSSGDEYFNPVVSITSTGNYFVHYLHEYRAPSGCTISYFYENSYSDSTFTSWSNGGSLSASSINPLSVITVGKTQWAILNNQLYVDLDETGTWRRADPATISNGNSASLAYGHDELHMLYKNSSNATVYRKYTIATATLSSETTISSATNDLAGGIVTDSNHLWAVYRSYVAANSYNVVYKHYNGSAWDSSATAVTTDNLNNTSVSVPQRIPNTAAVPVIWTSGTSSPYTVKGTTFSTVSGTVTDTGNQGTSYTGSLTGSSGDVIVKCGTWYYDTVNIVSGMTVKVCSSNGVTGGNLTIYANSVTVAGSIDGAGRGLPGGISIAGIGGTGGDSAVGGGSGSNTASAGGTGNYGGSAGSAGTNATGGLPGGNGAPSNGEFSGGVGGVGGGGSTSTNGGGGSIGGYADSGVNGDSTTDTSLLMGSGGGGGGTGGSGGGGGGGGTGAGENTAPGGTGGAGGGGGFGGKGGNGGAMVKIFSEGNLTVSGSIIVTGQSGVSGGSAGTAVPGANGTNGDTGCGLC